MEATLKIPAGYDIAFNCFEPLAATDGVENLTIA
jgi:hypothetical protein